MMATERCVPGIFVVVEKRGNCFPFEMVSILVFRSWMLVMLMLFLVICSVTSCAPWINCVAMIDRRAVILFSGPRNLALRS